MYVLYSLNYLAFGPIFQVLSTIRADSTVVPSAKVNFRPWVTVHFAQGTSPFKNRISLGIHVHRPGAQNRKNYFNTNIYMIYNQYKTETNMCSYFKTKVCTVGSYHLT